jgi:Protein of unknown function with PCYCGC motif
MTSKSRRHTTSLGRRALLYGAGASAVAALAAWRLWPVSTESTAQVITDATGDQIQTLPRDQVPVFARTDEIRGLYRYAVEHGDELQYVPCFCGCGRLGHTSNRDCYIKAFNPDGTLTFTSHAAT